MNRGSTGYVDKGGRTVAPARSEIVDRRRLTLRAAVRCVRFSVVALPAFEQRIQRQPFLHWLS